MKLIIPVIVGALIGYITNWLAIKMLFRPYNEVKIFGIRLPFTPGLIPKEKKRIAESVGSAVGTHLLSPEVIVNSLYSERVKKEISGYLENKVIYLRESSRKVGELIEDYGRISENIGKSIAEFVYDYIKAQYSRETMEGILKKYADNMLDYCSQGSAFTEINGFVDSWMEKIASSEGFKEAVESGIKSCISHIDEDKRVLIEVMPSEVINEIKTIIYKNGERESRLILNVIESSSIRLEIKNMISGIIEQNLGKVVTRLFGTDFISEKMLSSMEKYLENPENYDRVASMFDNILDNLLESRINSLAALLQGESREQAVCMAGKGIAAIAANKRNQEQLKNIIGKALNANRDQIEKNFIEAACWFAEKAIESGELKNIVYKVTLGLFKTIGSLQVNLIMKDIDGNMVNSLIESIRGTFGQFIRQRSEEIVELLDIPSMVEERINSFDAVFAEKIIIEVANRELKAITWLGALLGGIMGLLTPLMEVLNK